MFSGREFSLPDLENRAWNSFYHSGKVEDYIRYAALRDRAEADEAYAAGVPDADQDPGVNHQGADHRRE